MNRQGMESESKAVRSSSYHVGLLLAHQSNELNSFRLVVCKEEITPKAECEDIFANKGQNSETNVLLFYLSPKNKLLTATNKDKVKIAQIISKHELEKNKYFSNEVERYQKDSKERIENRDSRLARVKAAIQISKDGTLGCFRIARKAFKPICVFSGSLMAFGLGYTSQFMGSEEFEELMQSQHQLELDSLKRRENTSDKSIRFISAMLTTDGSTEKEKLSDVELLDFLDDFHGILKTELNINYLNGPILKEWRKQVRAEKGWEIE